MTYGWHFGPLLNFLSLWCIGLFSTVWLAALAIVLGTVFAVFVTWALYSGVSLVRALARCYVDLFRAIPALVLIGTLYFLLPVLVGIRVSAFATAVVALGLNLAPFAVECLRSGVESIPTIQYDSAIALGFCGWQRAYYIIGPQVVRRVIPPLVGQYVTTLKLTSLAATIGVQELWNVTSQVTTLTSLPIEARLFGATLYVLIIFPLLFVSFWLEHRFGVKGLGQGAER